MTIREKLRQPRVADKVKIRGVQIKGEGRRVKAKDIRETPSQKSFSRHSAGDSVNLPCTADVHQTEMESTEIHVRDFDMAQFADESSPFCSLPEHYFEQALAKMNTERLHHSSEFGVSMILSRWNRSRD